MKLTVCMYGKSCIAEHKNSSNTLFMHRLKSSTKFITWSMNYVMFSLSSFYWHRTCSLQGKHMHCFFNFHIPQYFLALRNSLLDLIGACYHLPSLEMIINTCLVSWIVFFLYFYLFCGSPSTELFTRYTHIYRLYAYFFRLAHDFDLSIIIPPRPHNQLCHFLKRNMTHSFCQC